jgi:hypothetical protein
MTKCVSERERGDPPVWSITARVSPYHERSMTEAPVADFIPELFDSGVLQSLASGYAGAGATAPGSAGLRQVPNPSRHGLANFQLALRP